MCVCMCLCVSMFVCVCVFPFSMSPREFSFASLTSHRELGFTLSDKKVKRYYVTMDSTGSLSILELLEADAHGSNMNLSYIYLHMNKG